jgi:hypothetical protein
MPSAMCSPVSPQALNPLAAAVVATAAIGLAASSGTSCSFLAISANLNETLEVTESSNGTAQVATTQGLFCETGYYDLDGDPMWIMSRAFLSTAIVLMALAALASWAMSFAVVQPSWRLWRCISALAAFSSLVQVPVFLVFEIEPCSQHKSVQTCTLSVGSYLLVAALLASITVTLITQCLDPPITELEPPLCSKKESSNTQREQDTDSSLDDSEVGGDGSLFSQLGSCIRKVKSRDDDVDGGGNGNGGDVEAGRNGAERRRRESSTLQTTSRVVRAASAQQASGRSDTRDIEQGLAYSLSTDDTASRHQGGATVGEESTQWESFASRFEIKPAKASTPPRPTVAAGSTPPTTASPAPKPTLAAVVPALIKAKADKASIFRDVRPKVPFDETPPRTKTVMPTDKVFRDPPGILGQELVESLQKQRLSPIRPSLSSDGGMPPIMSRRGKVLRGYSLLDDDMEEGPESKFVMSPPLEIVTLSQMQHIENDDDSIDLGFGALGEDGDMAAYFMSIQPPFASPIPASIGVKSEIDLVFGAPFHDSDPLDEVVEREKRSREQHVDRDDENELPQERTDDDPQREQDLIVEEVLRRRGGRSKKQRRKKSSGCSVSNASQPSLLDVTIEEETPEDLLLEEEQAVDPYNDTMLVRTRSAPNLTAYAYGGGTPTENCKSYECVHVNGINSYRLAETYWSDEPADAPNLGSQPHPVTPDSSVPGSFDGNQETMSFSSDPTERSRRARIARIQRLRREKQNLAQSVGGSSGSADPPRIQSVSLKNRPPRVPVVSFGEVTDLRLIELQRPNGAEYGPDEVSL